MHYDLELGRVKDYVKPGQRVMIQLPSGLRQYWELIANTVLEQGAEPVIWAGSCYGACDLPDYDCDLLIHFGHEEFTSS